MGVVYEAEHTVIKRRVALKVLLAEYVSRPDSVRRFVNEAIAVNRIGPRHIVDITDFGTTPDGENYFVMELLKGESLAGRLHREKRLTLELAIDVACQVADALSASHKVGIVHRDLKPDNIFLVNDEERPD